MAQLRLALVFLVYSVAILERTDALANGACPQSCSGLIPNHVGANAVGGGNPLYTFGLLVPGTVLAGSTVVVRIQATARAHFRGFMVRVKDASGNWAPTTFVDLGTGSHYKVITCSTTADTATHTNGLDATSVDISWVAPTEPGTYHIVATITQNISTYYTDYDAAVEVVASG